MNAMIETKDDLADLHRASMMLFGKPFDESAISTEEEVRDFERESKRFDRKSKLKNSGIQLDRHGHLIAEAVADFGVWGNSVKRVKTALDAHTMCSIKKIEHPRPWIWILRNNYDEALRAGLWLAARVDAAWITMDSLRDAWSRSSRKPEDWALLRSAENCRTLVLEGYDGAAPHDTCQAILHLIAARKNRMTVVLSRLDEAGFRRANDSVFGFEHKDAVKAVSEVSLDTGRG